MPCVHHHCVEYSGIYYKTAGRIGTEAAVAIHAQKKIVSPLSSESRYVAFCQINCSLSQWWHY
eukprot:scaffold306499_cov19-Prasinocladus_malaysianus.AAC.2